MKVVICHCHFNVCLGILPGACVFNVGSTTGKESSSWCQSSRHYSTYLRQRADADGNQGCGQPGAHWPWPARTHHWRPTDRVRLHSI